MAIHSTAVVRVVASASAASLVIASAGFGGVFAWKIGSQHSVFLACLTVLFAVALAFVLAKVKRSETDSRQADQIGCQ